MRGVRTKPKVGFLFNVQKQPVQESGHLDTKPDEHQGCRMSAGGASTSTTDSRKKGTCGRHHS